MGTHDFKYNKVPIFARKQGNINTCTSMSAAQKLALVPASRYYCNIEIGHTTMYVPSFIKIERFRWGTMTLNITRCHYFARKTGNINTLMFAAPKLALVPASRYYCDVT